MLRRNVVAVKSLFARKITRECAKTLASTLEQILQAGTSTATTHLRISLTFQVGISMVLTGAMTLVLPSLEIRAQVLTLTQGYVVPTKKVCALKTIPKFVKIRQTIMEVLSIVLRIHAMVPWPFSLLQVQP
jgi:hypothetical protein